MATAAAAASPAVEDSECSICHELLQDPKVLCCGHVLCAPCLVSWLTSQHNASCPLCRRPILPPDRAQSVRSFVDSLPTDGMQFCFHRNCGKNIVLSNNQQTAVKNGCAVGEGIIVASQSMVPQHLYEVRVEETQHGRIWNMCVGVVTTTPESLTLPCSSHEWPSAVIFGPNFVNIHGIVSQSSVGKKLRKLRDGQHVGVMVDHSRHLHLFIDGTDEGQMETPLPQPCFFLCDIWDSFSQLFSFSTQKVTALPVTLIS